MRRQRAPRCRWHLCVGPITAEPCRAKDASLPRVSSLFRPRAPDSRVMVEAPGTAPGSTTLIPRTVYRHSRQAGSDQYRHRGRAEKGSARMSLTEAQRAEIAATAGGAMPTRRATVPALEALLFAAGPGARPRLRPRHRLHGRRLRGGAGGARFLRPRHPARVGGCRADPLPDAAPAHHAVRDVRDQVPREAADLRRAAVDPPPHRERERIFRALFDPRPRVLHPRARAPCRPVRRSTARAAARCWTARKRPRCCASCAPTPSAATTITWRC